MAQVWDSDLAPNHKLVLLAYADAADDDGTHAFPGEPRLASMTGYSPSQVRRVTRELIEAGVLVRVKRGYRGQRAEFAVTLKGAQSARLSEEPKLSRNAHQSSRKGAHANDLKASAHARPPIQTHPKTSLRSVLGDESDTNWIGVWTALEELFGEVQTKTERSGRAKVARSLHGAGATYSEIHLRRKAWAKLYPEATCTDFALERHWARLGRHVKDTPKWTPESCTHQAAADRFGDGDLWCPACERVVS